MKLLQLDSTVSVRQVLMTVCFARDRRFAGYTSRFLPFFTIFTPNFQKRIMAKEKTIYICSECGADSPKWVGKRPSCGVWNT